MKGLFSTNKTRYALALVAIGCCMLLLDWCIYRFWSNKERPVISILTFTGIPIVFTGCYVLAMTMHPPNETVPNRVVVNFLGLMGLFYVALNALLFYFTYSYFPICTGFGIGFMSLAVSLAAVPPPPFTYGELYMFLDRESGVLSKSKEKSTLRENIIWLLSFLGGIIIGIWCVEHYLS